MERSPKRITRQLRDRKERKLYTDDWALGDADDEIEGPQSFDLDEKLNSSKFDRNLVKEMSGLEFNLAYIQQNGFTEPLIFHNRDGLGIRIPGPNFCVGDVKTCVGSKRLLDVMDVRTQKNMEMTMKQWQEYYDKTAKDRLLNVISLEFSHTKLENFVEAPTVVRQLDWVDRVWPRHLKNMQTESTNVMDEMMYPKVQKYCLMSVKGCFTDFHVDFGGTSVWYHILKGAKVFWLIPPTDKNLESYQDWVLSGKQGDTFFGDNVDICSRVYLDTGDTFFIPSGWIHAVYTPKDSLVFGGNFLHSFGIEKQLKIAAVEEQTKVPQKFRYPFFTEMLWYTLERYAHCLLGQSFIRIPSDDDEDNEKEWKPIVGEKLVPDDVALSPQELLGLKAIVLYLHQLPIPRKNVPALIYDPVSLLLSIRQIVEMHRYDDPAKAVTGKPILVWPGERAEDVGKILPPITKRSIQRPSLKTGALAQPNNNFNNKTSLNTPNTTTSLTDSDCWADSPTSSSQSEDISKRRSRCNSCQACRNSEDCNQCPNCMLRQKYAESSIKSKNALALVEFLQRKVCVMRECMAPVLLVNLVCSECGLDGWMETPTASSTPSATSTALSTLMECSLCWKIVHPICIGSKVINPQTIAIVNDDLPNSWECPLCLEKITTKPYSSHRVNQKNLKRQARLSTDEHLTGNRGSMDNNNSNSNSLNCMNDFSSNNNSVSGNTHFVNNNNNNNNNYPSLLGQDNYNYNCNNETGGLLNGNSNNSSINFTNSGLPGGHQRMDYASGAPPGNILIKEERLDIQNGGSGGQGKKNVMEKSARDDVSSVKQKLDEVVRRKSTEEAAAKAIAGKMNAALKRTLSSGSQDGLPSAKGAKFPRRILSSEDSSNTNGLLPPVLTSEERISNSTPNSKIKKIKKEIKEEPKEESEEEEDKVKETTEEAAETEENKKIKASPIKYPFRTELSSLIMSTSGKTLKKPTNVVRPAPIELSSGPAESPISGNPSTRAGKKPAGGKKQKGASIGLRIRESGDLLKDKSIWIPVFKWLDIKSLNRVLGVSKDWNRIGMSPILWERVDLSHKPITADLLRGVVRRQPCTVLLNWTKISKQQLHWLLSRLPQLRHLALQGLTWNTVCALKTCFCPALQGLDLGYVDNLSDSAVREILAPPADSRPGLTDSKSRLRHLNYLNLAGAHLSDVSLRYVTQHAGSISRLELSCCPRITDAGIAQLGAPDSPSLENLTHLFITGCPQVTNISLDHLKRCKKLVYLDIQNIRQITLVGLSKFLNTVQSENPAGKLIVKHSLPVSELENLNSLQQRSSAVPFYQSEMPSSANSLTSPGIHPHFRGQNNQNVQNTTGSSGPSSSLVVSIMP